MLFFVPQTRVDAIYFVKHLKVKITHRVCYDIVLHYMLCMYVYILYKNVHAMEPNEKVELWHRRLWHEWGKQDWGSQEKCVAGKLNKISFKIYSSTKRQNIIDFVYFLCMRPYEARTFMDNAYFVVTFIDNNHLAKG